MTMAGADAETPSEPAITRYLSKVQRSCGDFPFLDAAALLALPFVVLLVNDSWTFLQPISTIDPWVYTGYFFNLHQHLNVFPNTYYGSRLPWLLLGNAVHSVFAPATATIVLRLLLYYGGTVSLYVIVRALWHNRTAALVATVV